MSNCGVARYSHSSIFSTTLTWTMLVLWWGMLLGDAVLAQPFFFGNERPRESSSIMLSYAAVDFTFNGKNEPAQLLNFTDPAYGIVYSRSNLAGSFYWGKQQASDTTSNDLSLIDFNIAFWGEVFFSEAATSADHRLFAPIIIFSNFRKVSPSGLDVLEEFNVTTLGLGLGLGYYGAWGERTRLEIRSTPGIGYAARSFGDSAGTARLVETDAQLHLGQISGKLGLSLGYNFRIMVWDVNTSNAFGSVTEDFFKYRELKHTFHVGLNW